MFALGMLNYMFLAEGNPKLIMVFWKNNWMID